MANMARNKYGIALLALILSPLAWGDWVRNDTGPVWQGGADGTLDLTNAGDPVVVLFSARRILGYGNTFQGQTPAIDTTSPEVMNQAIATSRDGSGQLHTESWVRNTAKTGSTPIDTTVTGYNFDWQHYAMLLEGFSPTVSDSCSVGVAGYTNVTSVSCSVTVPANAIVVVFIHNNTNLFVTGWDQGATERLPVTSRISNSFVTAATKVETAGVTQAYGASFAASESGILQVLVFEEAAAGVTVDFNQDTYNPGNTINATATGYGSPMTLMTENAGGDTIPAEAGATAVNADFILCPPSGFQTAGACDNTQMGKSLTYTVAPGNATDTLTIQPGAGDSFDQMACDPGNAVTNVCDDDSLFNDIPGTYDLGDEYYAHVTTGACTVNSFGVAECTSLPANIELRLFDVSLGVWGDMVEFDIDTPPEGVPTGCEYISQVVGPMVRPITRRVICE